VFGTEKGDELGYFVVIERVAEAGHLLAAVFDLGGDLRCLHGLADVGQGRTFLGSLAGGSVAIGASFIAEEGGSGLLGGVRSGSLRGGNGERDGREDGQDGKDTGWADFERSHIRIFSLIPQFALRLRPEQGSCMHRKYAVSCPKSEQKDSRARVSRSFAAYPERNVALAWLFSNLPVRESFLTLLKSTHCLVKRF